MVIKKISHSKKNKNISLLNCNKNKKEYKLRKCDKHLLSKNVKEVYNYIRTTSKNHSQVVKGKNFEKENTNEKVIMWENTPLEIKEMLIKIGFKYYCLTNKIEIIKSDVEWTVL